MDAKGFMPDDAVIAGIRKDIEQYESQRASAYAQVRWRVPVFLGALLAVAAILAYGLQQLRQIPTSNGSRRRTCSFISRHLSRRFLLYGVAMKPATKLGSRSASVCCRWCSAS